MKLIFLVCALVSCSLANPVKPARRYFSEENDASYIKYLLVEKSPGLFAVEDLTDKSKIVGAQQDDVTFYLYTKENPNSPTIFKNGNSDPIPVSSFDPSKETVFIIHGWNNDQSSRVNVLIKAALLETADVNVFVVDWSGPANSLYLVAYGAVTDIGQYVADFINDLISKHGLKTSSLILCGHSLGAHVAGNAGAAIDGTVKYIVGMDPALPLFSMGNTDNRLDETDAAFVQVIHTNAGLLGFKSSIGNADYFPNGGGSQPGCGLDLTGSCSHGRSYQYFAESIRTSGFLSKECSSIQDYTGGNCDANTSSYMGGFQIDLSASGDFFLETNSEEPFARG